MGLFDRILGRQKSGKGPLSLQLLFPGKLILPPNLLERALRDYSPEMAQGTVERLEAPGEVAELEVMGWGRHSVQLVGFDAPMPGEVVERCVQPAHYGRDLKASARDHSSHVLLYYVGQETDPLEQCVALAAVAGVVSTRGALIVMNESGHTSLPAEFLLGDPEGEGDRMQFLRSLPIPLLYAGFVKLEVAKVRGVWMRTYGCQLLGLPDLAYHARSHDEARLTLEVFSNLLAYLRRSGARFKPGDTIETDPVPTFLKFRAAGPGESFLDNPGELFVVERISLDQTRRSRSNA